MGRWWHCLYLTRCQFSTIHVHHLDYLYSSDVTMAMWICIILSSWQRPTRFSRIRRPGIMSRFYSWITILMKNTLKFFKPKNTLSVRICRQILFCRPSAANEWGWWCLQAQRSHLPCHNSGEMSQVIVIIIVIANFFAPFGSCLIWLGLDRNVLLTQMANGQNAHICKIAAWALSRHFLFLKTGQSGKKIVQKCRKTDWLQPLLANAAVWHQTWVIYLWKIQRLLKLYFPTKRCLGIKCKLIAVIVCRSTERYKKSAEVRSTKRYKLKLLEKCRMVQAHSMDILQKYR